MLSSTYFTLEDIKFLERSPDCDALATGSKLVSDSFTVLFMAVNLANCVLVIRRVHCDWLQTGCKQNLVDDWYGKGREGGWEPRYIYQLATGQ